MEKLKSKSLKKTFPKIIFDNLAGTGAAANAAVASNNMMAAHPATAKTADAANTKIPKATDADARTVAEILSKQPSS